MFVVRGRSWSRSWWRTPSTTSLRLLFHALLLTPAICRGDVRQHALLQVLPAGCPAAAAAGADNTRPGLCGTSARALTRSGLTAVCNRMGKSRARCWSIQAGGMCLGRAGNMPGTAWRGCQTGSTVSRPGINIVGGSGHIRSGSVHEGCTGHVRFR